MKDQDKPIGFEYIITAEQYAELSENEKKLWHYHKIERSYMPRRPYRISQLMRSPNSCP